MNDTIINVRTDAGLKREAQEVAETLGFSLSSLINAFIKNLVKTKTVYFSDAKNPSTFLVQEMQRAQKEREVENWYTFTNNAKAIEFLKKAAK